MRSVLLVVSLLLALSLASGDARAQTLSFGNNLREAKVHYQTGNDYLSRELWDKARDEFAAAVQKEPLFTDAHYGLAQSYMGLRRYTSAIQSFERFITAARTLYALELRNSAARRGPTVFEVPAPVLLSLGSAHFHSGHEAEAEHYWLEAVKVRPRLGEAWNNLAALYAIQGRGNEGWSAAEKAERAGYRLNPKLKEQLSRENKRAAMPPGTMR